MLKGIYQIKENDNIPLMQFGFVKDTIIKLEFVINGIYIFSVRGSRVGIREEDLISLDLILLQAEN